MAESLLKKMNIPGVEVRSAGIFAENGSAASTNAKKVLDEQDIPHNHQASLLNDKWVAWSTYILTMTEGHRAAVISRYPEARLKTFTLKGFAQLDGDFDIADPFGGSIEKYRTTFLEMEEAIEKIAETLKNNI